MRLQNKINQLVIGASGSPRIENVNYCHLHKDGYVTGKTEHGERVKTSHKGINNAIWHPIKN
ncbi:MAG: hypothetical protein Unbinned6805contig1000_35 [Prokaryotic dsDNA virus sp.]|nr:MAG: hypothetical protein Unbinned6805contig1000_35 [Prokaryotic dsDNA virus sp.]